MCLGDLYFKGKGVKQNNLIAKKFYELSARYKNTIAFTKLGYLYYHGFGVEIDYFNLSENKINNNFFFIFLRFIL